MTRRATTATSLRFVDIAVNFTDCVFRGVDWKGRPAHDDDLDLVVARAKAAGVHRVIVTGTSLAQSKAAVEFCRKWSHDDGYWAVCTVGCHPAHADEFLLPSRKSALQAAAKRARKRKVATPNTDDLGDLSLGSAHGWATAENIEEQTRFADSMMAELQALIDANRDVVAAVGEIGLDYAELTPTVSKTLQMETFALQWSLARRTGLPVLLHSRDCGADFVSQLTRHFQADAGHCDWGDGGPPAVRGVVHSFTGDDDELAALLKLPVNVSINAAAFRTRDACRRAASIPVDRLLMETDAPWCDIKSAPPPLVHDAGGGPPPPPADFGYSWVTANRFPARPKTEFLRGLSVHRRNEPCHMIDVAELLAGARRWAAAGCPPRPPGHGDWGFQDDSATRLWSPSPAADVVAVTEAVWSATLCSFPLLVKGGDATASFGVPEAQVAGPAAAACGAPEEPLPVSTMDALVAQVNTLHVATEGKLMADGDNFVRTSAKALAEKQTQGRLFVARVPGEAHPVASACVTLVDAAEPPRWAEIGMVAVRAEYQQLGVGTGLFRAIEAWCCANGIPTVRVRVLRPSDGLHEPSEKLRHWCTGSLGFVVDSDEPVEQSAPNFAGELAVPCNVSVMTKVLLAAAADS